MSRRFIALVLVLFMTVVSAACSGGTASGGSEEKAAGEPLPIVTGGATDYVVVRSDLYNSENVIVKSAVELRNAIRTVTGTDMQIKTDWDGTDDNTARKEILVGDTNRQESIDALAQLTDEQYIIKVCGDGTKIVITGKTERATEAAVEYFLNTYLKYFSDTDFTASSDFSLTTNIEEIRNFAGSAGDQLDAGSDGEKSLVYQDAGTVENGKRTLSRTDVLIYKLDGTQGKGYSLSLDIEGQYLVTVSTDLETFYRLFAYTDDGYGTPRGTYSADLTEYFASSGTVYVRITDYHPLDENSPVIYSLTLTETDDRTLG